MKNNKYKYLSIVQGNYGYGWDDLSSYESYSDACKEVKVYRENERNARHRVIERRELRA